MFRGNLTQAERIVRFILGFVLLTWAVAGGAGWGYLGVALLATACWGFSPLYAFLRRRRYPREEDSSFSR